MNKKKKTIIISLMVLVISLGIGFASFSTILKINGSAKVSPNSELFKVVFAKEKDSNNNYSYGTITPTTNPQNLEKENATITNTEVPTINNIGVTFTEDNQTATYDFLIVNIGKYDAYLTNIVFGEKECSTPVGSNASQDLVNKACEHINMQVILGTDNNELTLNKTTTISSRKLSKGTDERIRVIISYEENAPLVDGNMEVSFDSISLYYKTIDESEKILTPLKYNNPDKNYTFRLKNDEDIELPEENFNITLAYKDETDWAQNVWIDGTGEYVGSKNFIKISYTTSSQTLYINTSGVLETSDNTHIDWLSGYYNYYGGNNWESFGEISNPHLIFENYYPIDTLSNDNSEPISSKYLSYFFNIEEN